MGKGNEEVKCLRREKVVGTLVVGNGKQRIDITNSAVASGVMLSTLRSPSYQFSFFSGRHSNSLEKGQNKNGENGKLFPC